MSFTERDLRDALEPLAGDPRAIASQVLAALPPAPAPAPTPTPAGRAAPRGLPWWLLLAGATVVFALGFVLGQALASSKLAPVKDSPPRKSAPVEPIGIEVLAVIGRCAGYGTKSKDVVAFTAGQKAPLGLFVQSEPDGQAALRVGEGFEIHVDASSSVRIDSPQHIICKEGRYWIDVHRSEPLLIDVDSATQVVARDAEFLLITGADGPQVMVLRGVLELAQGKAGRTIVKQGLEIAWDRKGPPEARPWEPKSLLALGAWQAELLRALRRER